jgi:hypothetical protein
MANIKRGLIFTLFSIVMDFVFGYMIFPLFSGMLSKAYAFHIALLLDFLIVCFVYYKILEQYKWISTIAGLLSFAFFMAFMSCLHYLAPSEHSARYLLKDYLLEALFSEPLALIAFFNVLFSTPPWLWRRNRRASFYY